MSSRLIAALGALCVLTAQSPAPVPGPTTLPEIGRTRARGLCTTVRDNVAPAVLGMMKSDELVGAGHRAFRKMADDQTARSAEALDLDRIYLNKIASAMAHNLAIVDKLLGDQKRFPKNAATDEERTAQTLKTQLTAVADEQRKTLSLLNGVLDADEQGRMKTEFPGGRNGILNAVGSEYRKGAISTPMPKVSAMGNDPTSFVGANGLSMPLAGTMNLDPRALVTGSTAKGHTIYDLMSGFVEVRQTAIAKAEQTLTPTVVAISAACRSELAPAPSPSP